MKFDFCSQSLSQSQSSRFVSLYFRVGLNGDCWLLHLIRSHRRSIMLVLHSKFQCCIFSSAIAHFVV